MKTLEEMTLEEKWEIFPILLEEHNPLWKYIYKEYEYIILFLLKNDIIRINHIGSTSVEDLISKPTIDILIEIKDETDMQDFKSKMESIGFICSNQQNEPEFHWMFLKGYTNQGFKGQVFHVHVRRFGDWNELYFRDYLNLHADTRKQYGKLKMDLQKKYKHHRDNYTNNKTDFILQHTNIARTELKDKYKK